MVSNIHRSRPQDGYSAVCNTTMFNNAFNEAGQLDSQTLIPLTYAVMLVLIIVLLRSFSGAIAALLVISFSTVTSLGIAGYLGIGDWDFALSGFHGTSREPIFEQTSDSEGFRPVYQRIDQIGLELQYTSGSWLWKFEGITRSGNGATFQAAVAGFEYTFFQAF